MLLIGLTGSISSGKTTVSRILSSPPHNLPIIDADLISRQVLEPGTRGYAAVVSHFGASTPGLVGADGTIDRAALGRRVFGEGEESRRERAVLNGIVHPLVRREMYKSILRHHLQGHWAVILDIPLLFESRLDLLCGHILVVLVSSLEEQLTRLVARDGVQDATMTRADALRRVQTQMPAEEKVRRLQGIYAHRGRGSVVMNDGSVEELRGEVGRVMEGVRRGREGWWRRVLWGVPPVAVVVGVWVCVVNWWWRRRVMEREREKAKL